MAMQEVSSKLVQRLRDQGKDAFAKQYSLGMFKLCDEAAARIEALEAALQSPPVVCGSLPSGESDPAVTPDYAGGDELAVVRSLLKQSGYDDRAGHYECYKDFDCIKFYRLVCMAQAATSAARIEALENALREIMEPPSHRSRAKMSDTRTIHDPFHNKAVQISDRLTDRLRGKYACGPVMPNGEPEFGWRQWDTLPIQHEAADRIEALEAALHYAVEALEFEGFPVEAKHARALAPQSSPPKAFE
jgi:hypothetical protein